MQSNHPVVILTKKALQRVLRLRERLWVVQINELYETLGGALILFVDRGNVPDGSEMLCNVVAAKVVWAL